MTIFERESNDQKKNVSYNVNRNFKNSSAASKPPLSKKPQIVSILNLYFQDTKDTADVNML